MLFLPHRITILWANISPCLNKAVVSKSRYLFALFLSSDSLSLDLVELWLVGLVEKIHAHTKTLCLALSELLD